MGFRTIDSELGKEMITWIMDQPEEPKENVRLRTATYGTYEWEDVPTRTEEGEVHEKRIHLLDAGNKTWLQ